MRISDWSSDVCSSDLQRRGQPEGGDRDEAGADRVEDRHLRRGDQPRHDQEPAADTEKSRKAPGAETIAEHFRSIMAIAGDPLNAGLVSTATHQQDGKSVR